MLPDGYKTKHRADERARCLELANPVDCDTRDGCTRLGAGMGAGMGAMHPIERNWQTLLRPLVYSVENVQF